MYFSKKDITLKQEQTELAYSVDYNMVLKNTSDRLIVNFISVCRIIKIITKIYIQKQQQTKVKHLKFTIYYPAIIVLNARSLENVKRVFTKSIAKSEKRAHRLQNLKSLQNVNDYRKLKNFDLDFFVVLDFSLQFLCRNLTLLLLSYRVANV